MVANSVPERQVELYHLDGCRGDADEFPTLDGFEDLLEIPLRAMLADEPSLAGTDAILCRDW